MVIVSFPFRKRCYAHWTWHQRRRFEWMFLTWAQYLGHLPITATLSSLLFWIFSLHVWNVLWECIRLLFLLRTEASGDCLSTWGRKKQLDLSLTEGPCCFFSPRVKPLTSPTEHQEGHKCAPTTGPFFSFGAGRKWIWSTGRVTSAGSAWRFFRSCKQAFCYFWKVQIHRDKEVADCTESL